MHRECEEKILAKIRPESEEKDQIFKIADDLVSAVDKSGIAKGMVAGSVARDTWVSGDRDLDIFMLFSPSLPREELEEKGLFLAREIALSFNGKIVEKYAEHPYINANIRGYDVDLVPCYAVSDASKIQSAVDRTPFHTRYMKEKIVSLSDDVLLLKQFSKSCGVYGSDQMTGGFAGYLCEILIAYYGGFFECINAASKWHPGIVIDIEKHQAKEFDDPLVVIDPVDPKRNVAASLSATRMYEFSEYARGYLKNPSCEFFRAKKREIFLRSEFSEKINERETIFYGISFDTPGVIPDVIVPQLKKSASSVTALLERNNFAINRSGYFMGNKKSLLLFELLYDTLPVIERRQGPPVWEEENSEKFISKHLGQTFSGPYIREGKYYVEIKRRHSTAESLFNSDDFKQSGLGKHVKKSILDEYQILKNSDCWTEEFSEFLYEFITKISPLSEILLDADKKR
ncbi:CCA tRNA nucleotidyltransferase [Methanomicrobium antiquum]|uniref:CCA-adding enzyme n=1 Tax=Methanomicrobium antiquum TaxID=487686 RepID=A0AAF0FPY2_9EURY|nr:CCA tRNA nucleotidyltransferase [Methanomicrobium antiquum]WFN35821.1 CCA tRNA nucleotidyltransferase [Methanomicrobium antiquum]